MKIVIVNAHSYDNRGDAAILNTMLDSLAVEFPNSSYVVLSDTPKKDQPHYPSAKVIGVAYPWQEKNGLSRMFSSFKFYILFWIQFYILKYLPVKYSFASNDVITVLSELQTADLVISCGGGYINSLGKLFYRLSVILAGKKFGCPTVCYAQSVSDLHNCFHKMLVKYVINNIELFIARENITYNYLEKIGVQMDKVEICADSAFSLKTLSSIDVDNLLLSSKTNGVGKMGLTVTRWSFPEQLTPHEKSKEYIKSIQEMVQFATQELNLDIYIIPQVVGPNDYSDDRITGQEIFGELNNNKIHYVNDSYSPSHLKYLISCMDIFVGTRMHSNIFALGARVPTLAIAYQDKTKGIMDMLGLSKWSIDINNMNSTALVNKLSLLWEEKEQINSHLQRKMPEIEESAILSSRLTKNVYEQFKLRTKGFS
jgi:colanic acid/amylovoran biosynthesis protein